LFKLTAVRAFGLKLSEYSFRSAGDNPVEFVQRSRRRQRAAPASGDDLLSLNYMLIMLGLSLWRLRAVRGRPITS
jgi:hypothetical protein